VTLYGGPTLEEGRRAQVTVVIPVWDDYAVVVADAVNSVLAQEVAAELVVVDNASSRELPALPVPVRTVRLSTRASVGVARNVGLSLVGTELVLFLDADDLLPLGTLRLLLARFEEDPLVAAVCGGVVAWNPSTGDLRQLDFPSRRTSFIAKCPRGYRFYAAIANRMPTTGCVLMRTALARDANGFSDADFGEDWALNVALAFRGRIEFVPRPGRLLRVHATSLRARPRTRAEVARGFALLQARLKTDPACPRFLRLTQPLLATYHGWRVRRLTPGGRSRPSAVFAAVGETGLFAGGRTQERPAAVTGPH
jgi:Glycosyl transferase family 2